MESGRPGDTAVIVFWSAGCEASLERLRQLATWHDSSQVLNGGSTVDIWGVHCPRFPAAEDADEVAFVMDRCRIPFRTVHDPEFKTWSRYNPEGWPTTVVIDNGSVAGVDHGLAPLTSVLGRLERQPEDRLDADTAHAQETVHTRDTAPVPTNTVADRYEPDRLKFPRSVVMDGDRMLIADTGNDRILAGRVRPDLSIFVVDRIYDGLTRPSSLAPWSTDAIAVVEDDRQVSRVDSETGVKQVVTDKLTRAGGLCVDADGSLVVTDSAANRIHRITADNNRSSDEWSPRPIAGGGRLGTRAGRADAAEFAQPVAVSRSAGGLIIVDAASSSLRLLTDSGKVMNLTDGDLYRFGLVDGVAHRALLQRPSDLCTTPGGDIIVADSGNHHLRRLTKRRLETVPIRGLRHPMGVTAIDNDWVAVADTNNHRIVLANCGRGMVQELRLGGLTGAARSTDLGEGRSAPTLVSH